MRKINATLVMKDYYLIACVNEVYETKVQVKDVSASVCFDLSEYNLEAFRIIKERAKIFIENIKPVPYYEEEEGCAYMLEIIKSYKSKELDRFIKSLDKN